MAFWMSSAEALNSAKSGQFDAKGIGDEPRTNPAINLEPKERESAAGLLLNL